MDRERGAGAAESGNTVTITVPTSSLRYLRLNVTANTGWPAAQLSELQIFS